MTTTATAAPAPRRGRARGVLAGLALVLACLALVLLSVTAWLHQVALNTDRFTSVVEEISAKPAVTDAVAHRLSVQVVDALDVQGRLEERLPDPLDRLAAVIVLNIEQAIEQRLQTAFQNPDVQEAWIAAVERTHRGLVALLRDEAEAAVVIDGYVYFDAFALVGPAIELLQEIGLIPADVVLPDLTARETADVLGTKLEASLGITLPPTFGLIKLMPADRLLAAQGAVRAFDLLIVLLAVITVALALLAIWLARKRLRMIVFLTLGAVIGLVLARLAIRGIEELIVSGITDEDASTTLRSALDITISNLVAFTNWVIIVAAVVAVVAYVVGRPRGTLSARGQRAWLERLAIGTVFFVIAWIALGIEIAVIAAALFIVFALALSLLSDDEEEPAGGDGALVPATAIAAAGAPAMPAPTLSAAVPPPPAPATYVTPPPAAQPAPPEPTTPETAPPAPAATEMADPPPPADKGATDGGATGEG